MTIKKTTPKKTTKKPPNKQTKKPTLKQSKVLKETSENLGNKKSKGEILRDAGYSESVAKKPSIVFESKGIRQAFKDAGINDEYLTKKNLELLEAHQIGKMLFPHSTTEEQMKTALEENVPGARYITYNDEETKVPGKFIRVARFSYPDRLAQDKALDKAYKVIGSYAPEKHRVEGEFSLLSLFKQNKQK